MVTTPDQRKQIFDDTPELLKQFEAGTPTSASQLNTLVDAENKRRSGVPAPEQVNRTRRGGSIDFGVVRGWANPTDDFMDMSLISRDSETGTWFIPEEATVEVVCSPGLKADDYETVQWIGESGENYPLTLPSWITVLAQPIVSVGTDLVAMWLPSLVPAQDIPANLPVTDGYNVNGAAEVGFVINP